MSYKKNVNHKTFGHMGLGNYKIIFLYNETRVNSHVHRNSQNSIENDLILCLV